LNFFTQTLRVEEREEEEEEKNEEKLQLKEKRTNKNDKTICTEDNRIFAKGYFRPLGFR